MAINQNIEVYGREATKQSLFGTKAKTQKTYGLAFPFGDIEDGTFLKKSSDVQLIKSSLRQLLLTRRGERVMLPNYGTNLKNYLMEPLDQALLSQIKREISESIYKYAPNVNLNLLQVFPLDQASFNGGNVLLIKLFCSIKDTENLIFEVDVEIK